ncbi:uroporphyrinogen decarboxylase family protein [uncultured Parabacteroides sp.]|uniref:uroporphyrinogen decarboxylase family protein n=1 Tax=uncultured Parabacteroides sp. TaxID=512312 RepID=UPI0026303C67|nr:uroporphyrinogen decarboxylase family protein [uncultured Parabacteroides sp.]
MTGYERIQAALSGKKPDKTPIMLHNFMMAVEEAGYTMAQYRNNPKIIAECFIRAIDKYQYDGVLVDIDTVTLAGACGVEVDFPENEPARSHTGCISSLAEVEQLKPVDILSYKYANIWCEAVYLLKSYFKDEIYVRGNCDQAPFSLATMIRGVENMMMDLCLEDEKRVFTLLDYCSEATTQFIRMMKEAGADMVSNGDSPAGPSMLSPEMYGKFALPYEKRVCEYAHKLDVPYMLHICGNTDLILDRMVTTGADSLELDYKTDIHKAEEMMRGKIVFSGNIDPSGVIALGTPELVIDKTIELLEIFKDNPRLILNAGCAIPSITPPDNLFAMISTAREL